MTQLRITCLNHWLFTNPRFARTFFAICIAGLLCTVRAHPSAIDGTPTGPGVDWSHKPLANQDLRDSDLRAADLSMANLKGASLQGAQFDGADLDRVELDGADLTGATGLGTADVGLGISAKGTNFTRADLRRAKLNGTYFENATFDHADMRDSILAGRCQGATFKNTDVRGMISLSAMMSSRLREELSDRGAIATKAAFEQAVKNGRNFSNLDLSNVDLKGANLRGAKLAGVMFHTATLDGADLTGADLRGTKFYWSSMVNTILINANLEGATVDSVEASGIDFTGANLKRASLRGGTFTKSKFNSTNLTDADLSFSDVTNASFANAEITGIAVESAIIENVHGLDAATFERLHDDAARWKHDLNTAINNFVRHATFPLFFVIWPIAAAMLYGGWRAADNKGSYVMLSVIHGVTAIPLVAYFLFGLVGGATTVQLTGSMAAWSMWVGLWPLLYFGAIALIFISLIAGMIHLGTQLSTSPRKAWGLAVLCSLLVPVASALTFFMTSLIGPTA